VGGGREEFDVVDLGAAPAGDAAAGEGLADAQGEISKRVDVGEFQGQAVAAGEEKPVPAPGDVADDLAVSVDHDADAGGGAVAGDVLDGDAAVVVEAGGDDADGGVDAVFARLDAAEVGEGDDQPDRAGGRTCRGSPRC